ncbi:MAG: helix-turn-helix domain-containing protein [Clostridiales bacterium]|jgi:ribosome-binding protein aMBF1 (putative translation factor)|nr:helix-turn-helix domain-containing protein [Clostridiales bacterium]
MLPPELGQQEPIFFRLMLSRYFGKRIKAARLDAGITHEKLVEKVNLSSGHCAHVERGAACAILQAAQAIKKSIRIRKLVRMD